MDNKNQTALRYDAGKPGLELVPMEFVHQINEVFRFGANKYEKDNWKRGMDWDKCYNAAQRHLYKWWSKDYDDLDEESGLSHLAHAAWNLMALDWYLRNNVGKDTR